jgi:hypothetical protein
MALALFLPGQAPWLAEACKLETCKLAQACRSALCGGGLVPMTVFNYICFLNPIAIWVKHPSQYLFYCPL